MSRLGTYFRLAANIFRKPVTVDEGYGFMPDTFRWLPRRNADRCTGCGACNERCSSGATTMTDKDQQRTVRVDGFHCIYCGRCAEVCPEHALELTFEPGTPEEKTDREEALKKAGVHSETDGLTLEALKKPANEQAYVDRISLTRFQGEEAPMVDTAFQLQHCSVCGEIMPVTEKHLKAIRERTLKNLQPDTAKVIDKDMEKYLTACIACRQKHSLEWNTHPRKWI